MAVSKHRPPTRQGKVIKLGKLGRDDNGSGKAHAKEVVQEIVHGVTVADRVFEEPDYEVELLPLNALTLDWDALPEGMESVNRRPDMNWVKALDKNYNPYVLGLFIVWRNPDGKLIIIDGQHRYLAGIEAGYKWPVIVQIHSDLTRALAAHIFTQANTRRGWPRAGSRSAIPMPLPTATSTSPVPSSYDRRSSSMALSGLARRWTCGRRRSQTSRGAE
jgi:hypothetical protein